MSTPKLEGKRRGRNGRGGDTMKGGTGTNATGGARVRGILLKDRGYTELKDPTHTITLAEYRKSMAAPDRGRRTGDDAAD